MAIQLSPQRRTEILDALRRGTVPRRGLDALAVGLNRFEAVLEETLSNVASGQAAFKAVRGDYGCGKTFFARWLQERARQRGFAVSEVQISETETPLHRLETVYRRLIEHLSTATTETAAFRSVVDGWLYTLEEDAIAAGTDPQDAEALFLAGDSLMEKRLAQVSRTSATFAAVLRAYRRTLHAGDAATAEGLLAWLGGQPNIAASVKRAAQIKGDVDHFTALNFLQGLLVILRDSGHSGLVLVLDEIETLQRVRSDAREKGLNALRQFIDEVDSGRFPGLFLVITGTPAFYDGSQGIRKLAPLAQRLDTHFDEDGRFDNPRAPQLRLLPFRRENLIEAGLRVRDIYASGCRDEGRLRSVADNALVERLALRIGGALGDAVGVAPRLFLKKLVADVLDRVDAFEEFNPALHYSLTLRQDEMTEEEKARLPAASADDIRLEW
jgi:hypothetical protein